MTFRAPTSGPAGSSSAGSFTLEFSLVAPGQPEDYDLEPPLGRGEVIEVHLRAPGQARRPEWVAEARSGRLTPWQHPRNSPAPCSRLANMGWLNC
jgi:hypothetical protein